jgi:hypothetical protein
LKINHFGIKIDTAGVFIEATNAQINSDQPLKLRSIIVISLLFTWKLAMLQSFRSVPNDYFKRGEKLSFRIAFHSALTGNLTAGTATLELTKENKQIEGRNTYHAIGYGKTTGFIEVFYQVEQRYESFFDENALITWYFSRSTRENKYRKNENISFRHREKIAVTPKKVMNVPENIQDMISAFYYARCINLDGVKPGKEFPVPFLLDDSVYYSTIRYLGKENVKTRLGRFSCIKIKPMVATGNVFDDPYPVTLWVTNDGNRIPILIESELSVGSVRIELTSFSGLNNPVDKLED